MNALADQRQVRLAQRRVEQRLQLGENRIHAIDQQRQVIQQVKIQARKQIGQIRHVDVYAAGVPAQEVLDAVDRDAQVAQEVRIRREVNRQRRLELADETAVRRAHVAGVHQQVRKQHPVVSDAVVVLQADVEVQIVSGRTLGQRIAVGVDRQAAVINEQSSRPERQVEAHAAATRREPHVKLRMSAIGVQEEFRMRRIGKVDPDAELRRRASVYFQRRVALQVERQVRKIDIYRQRAVESLSERQVQQQ